MDRRTFLAGLPNMGLVGVVPELAVPLEKERCVQHEGYLHEEEEFFGFAVDVDDDEQWERWIAEIREIWGPDCVGRKMVCTYHPDGYTVRFVEGS